MVILEKDFAQCSDKLVVMTDDGSYGTKGLVTTAIEELVAQGNQYDEVIAIGPMMMMKFVCQTTQKLGLKTVVSMNAVMVDGTGMCGGCRVTVGGQTKFACVDGPDFDGHQVDRDEIIKRVSMYKEFEANCNLMNQEVK